MAKWEYKSAKPAPPGHRLATALKHYNRYVRYKNRLLKEGFAQAAKLGITVILPPLNADEDSGMLDVSGLYQLGAHSLPALARKAERAIFIASGNGWCPVPRGLRG